MPGQLEPGPLEQVLRAWRRSIRLDPLLSRTAIPELRPFAVAFNLALGGDDVNGELAERCNELVHDEVDPGFVIEVTTLLAGKFADELGTASGAVSKGLVETLGHVCGLLTTRMVMDERELARHDSVTALENRHAFIAALVEDASAGRSITLALIDLDDLKRVNDEGDGGHLAGDRYLRVFASALTLALPEEATPYRVGGDEFAVRWLASGEGQVSAALDEFRGKEGTAPFSYGLSHGLVDTQVPDDEETDLRAGCQLYATADRLEREMKEARKAAALAADAVVNVEHPDG